MPGPERLAAREVLRRGARVEVLAPGEPVDPGPELAALTELERQWRGFRRELLVSNRPWQA